MVKRWVNEAQEAVSSDNIMVQVSRFTETADSLSHSSYIEFVYKLFPMLCKWLILQTVLH